MPTFENKEPESILPSDIDSLIGRAENPRLEFKETIDNTPAYELAKDLASFSNAEGAYIIIGAEQDKSTEKCTKFRSVQNVPGTMKKIRDVASTNLEKPLSLVPFTLKASTGESIVAVYIPPSPILISVTTNRKGEYWIRRGTDKREMTDAEIRTALASGQAAIDDASRLNRQKAADPTRLHEITDRQILWDVLDARFLKTIGQSRYMRLTLTPHLLRADAVNTSDSNLRAELSYPTTGQRDAGWNIRTGSWGAHLISDPIGVHSDPLIKNGLKLPFISLTRSGHLEYWVAVEKYLFQPTPPRLPSAQDLSAVPIVFWPTAVIEYPVSFLRFARQFFAKLDISGNLTFRMEYRAVKGCVLPPYIPGNSVSFEEPRPYPYDDFQLREIILSGDWDPDEAALEMITKFYQAFGFDRSHIPFFASGKFGPPPPY
jgi:hypothetical protein